MGSQYQDQGYTLPSNLRSRLEFQVQVVELRRGGHMRLNDSLPPPVRKVRRGWMRMPNAIVDKDAPAPIESSKTPIQASFINYARSHKARFPEREPPTPTLTNTRTESPTSSDSESSTGYNSLFTDDNDCPDSPGTDATSICSPDFPDSDTSADSECGSPKDAMHVMKAIQDSLETLELYGPDSLAYYLIDRSLSGAKEADIVGSVVPMIVMEATTMRVPNADRVMDSLRTQVFDWFMRYWSEDGWKQDISILTRLQQDAYTELKQTNVGVLIGSLYRHHVLSAKEIHQYLDTLVEGYVSHHHLRVMRAIVKHSGSRLCEHKNETMMKMFVRKLIRESPHTGLFVWGWDRESGYLRSDIELTLEKWCTEEKARRAKEMKMQQKVKVVDLETENMKQLSRLGRRIR